MADVKIRVAPLATPKEGSEATPNIIGCAIDGVGPGVAELGLETPSQPAAELSLQAVVVGCGPVASQNENAIGVSEGRLGLRLQQPRASASRVSQA